VVEYPRSSTVGFIQLVQNPPEKHTKKRKTKGNIAMECKKFNCQWTKIPKMYNKSRK